MILIMLLSKTLTSILTTISPIYVLLEKNGLRWLGRVFPWMMAELMKKFCIMNFTKKFT